jgi:zinc protease
VLGKAARLARYDLTPASPDFADKEVAMLRGVTAADVMRVYQRYIKNKPHVAASFVPKGKPALALEGSTRAKVVEERSSRAPRPPSIRPPPPPTSARPPASTARWSRPSASARNVKLPAVWQASLQNGLKVYGIKDEELPVAQFELAIAAGGCSTTAKPGAANLLALMLMRGTARRTPAELENALKSLGADIRIVPRNEHFVLSGRTLARNLQPTIDLVEEILLEPRWDQEELALQKAAVTSAIQSSRTQPNALAARAVRLRHLWREPHLSRSALGTESSVAALTMEDLKRYHARNLAPNIASFRIVGAVDQPAVRSALADLGSRWARRDVKIPDFPAPAAPEKAPHPVLRPARRQAVDLRLRLSRR